MKQIIRNWLTYLSALIDLYCVPAAAALVGWLYAPGLARWILESFEFAPAARLALADSAQFMLGLQIALAALLFFIAWRYLA